MGFGFFGKLWALVVFVLIAACARELKQESDLKMTAEEFQQNIQSVNQESLDKIIKSETPSSVPEKAVETEVETPKGDTPPSSPKVAIDIKKPAKESKAENKVKTGWQPAHWPFGVGEQITWVLKYGPIEAGVATLEVREPQVINGEPVLHYVGKVKSTKLMELVYKVNDTMHTWTGLYDHLPRRQEIHQLESGRWGKRVVVFDQKASKAKFLSFTDFPDGRSEEIKREDDVTPFSQDVFGALYFVRFLNPEEPTNFPIHDRWKNWANELTFLGREKIKVPAGEFQTLHYKMLPRVSGQLEPKGDVEIWIWDDPSRLLVQYSAHVKVGSVTGELKEYKPGKPFAITPPLLKTPKIIESQALK